MVVWMEDMQKKLKREINDLDNVRAAMAYLSEVREKEGQIEQLFGPVEEMYAMLNRYEVRVSKEEQAKMAATGKEMVFAEHDKVKQFEKILEIIKEKARGAL